MIVRGLPERAWRYPYREDGPVLLIVERTGARLLLRWRGRVERNFRWRTSPDHVEPWQRETMHPLGMRPEERWVYAFTRGGVLRQLRRWVRRQEAEAVQHEEIPVSIGPPPRPGTPSPAKAQG